MVIGLNPSSPLRYLETGFQHKDSGRKVPGSQLLTDETPPVFAKHSQVSYKRKFIQRLMLYLEKNVCSILLYNMPTSGFK